MVETIKEMIERIKQPRKLSPSNWRYRLLHWVMGVDHKNYKDGWLYKYQNYFYRAYCPLFWATIILLVTLPITFPAKMLIAGARVLTYFAIYAFGPACSFVKRQALKLRDLLDELEARWRETRRPLTKEEIEALDEEARAEFLQKQIAKDRKRLIAVLTELPQLRDKFTDFWDFVKTDMDAIGVNQAKELFAKISDQLNKAEAKVKARQAKIKAFILASLHVTNVLMRVGAYVAALVALVGGCYLMVDVVLPLVWVGLKWVGGCIAYVFSMRLHEDFWPWFFRIVGWGLSICFGLITGCALGYAAYKAIRSKPMRQAMAKTGKIAFPPLSIFISVIRALVFSVRTGFAIAAEFVVTLFAENCPPIILVEEEEEELEAISEHA